MAKARRSALDPTVAAARVKAPREFFRQCFDPFAERFGAPVFYALASARQRKQALKAGPTQDAADFAAAFREAEGKGFLGLLIEAYGDQLLSPPQGPTNKVVIPALAARDPRSRQSIITTYEKVISDLKFQKPDDVVSGLMRATRNTCKIKVENGEAGTGFLIGPRLVLTCWHVIEALVDSPKPGDPKDHPGYEKEESAARLQIEFDLLARAGQDGGATWSCGVVKDWLVAGSRSAAHEHMDSAELRRPTWSTEAKDLETYTDFAVLELDAYAGFDRGYYDITTGATNEPKGRMIILHHPGNYPIRLSAGTFDVDRETKEHFASVASSPNRALHNANTIGGSSGGLCLNYEMEPVAIHQAGLEKAVKANGTATDNNKTNVAIPIAAVLAKAAEKIRARIGDFKAVRCRLSNGKALIGRFTLQEAIASAAIGASKILVVQIGYDSQNNRPRQIGKTFSTEVISDFLNPSLHHIVRMSAAATRESAYKTAASLLAAVGEDLAAQLPTEDEIKATSQSTEVNDSVKVLAHKVGELLDSAATRRVLWIVIDELDLHTLTNGSTRLFFDKFYREIAVRQNLRLVLIGLSDPDLPALQEVQPKKVDELKMHLGRDDVKRWIAQRLSGSAVSPDALHTFADIAIRIAEREEKPARSATVSRIINELFEPSFPQKGL